MQTVYKVSDFYAQVIDVLKEKKDIQKPSEVAKEAIKRMKVDAEGEFWGMARLKLKNRIRTAGAHLAEAGFLHTSHHNPYKLKGWFLTEKAKRAELSPEELIKQVRLAVRKKQAEKRSHLAINGLGKISSEQVFVPKVIARKKREQVTTFSRNTIMYGPPATGKTEEAVSLAIKILGLDKSKIKEAKQAFRAQIGDRVEIVTFHPNYRYDHFIESVDTKGKIKDGIFKKIARRAIENFQKHPDKPKSYVLIIDEIHRADVAKIFGEFITLIDEEKRLSAENELTVTLTSGERFSLPPNLYIIGTMNASDRPMIDSVLRKSFEFIPIPPRYDLVNMHYGDFLKTLNTFIRESKGTEYLLGHNYFIQTPKSFDFLRTINHQIIPVLNEYFQYDVAYIRGLLQNSIDEAPSTKGKFEMIENEYFQLEMIRVGW